MAQLPGTFDPSAVKDERAILPDGEVLAQIVDSDLKATKENTGQVATFEWEILDGPLKGRKLWTRENVQNQNAQAQEIGQRNLKRICEAAGTGPISNTDALHFKPMYIKIGQEKPQPGYDPRNDIKGYRSATGQAAPPAPQGQQQTTGQPPTGTAPSTTGAVPWPSR